MLTIVIKLYITSLVLIFLITVKFVPLTNAPSLLALPLVTANLISY